MRSIYPVLENIEGKQEMPGDTESRKIAPAVVEQNSVTSKAKVQNYNNVSNGLAGEHQQCQQQEEGDYFGNPMACEIQSLTHEEEYRDIYELDQPPKDTWFEEQSLQKLRYDEDSYQRQMSLVREKFIEAKNLATDGKLLDSKFQDAVEVLNSNRDLFLKFLEEPNSLFTKCIFEPRTGKLTDPWSLSQPSQKTRITVLKPSNTMDRKANRSLEGLGLSDSDKSVGKPNEHHRSTSSTEARPDALSQPTRIVILKPSPGKPYNTMTIPANNFPTLRSSSGGLACNESASSREAVEGLRQQDQDSLGRNIEDEAMSSSVSSNGCTGHESLEDEVESASRSEIVTSAAECSWGINRSGSPLSASSFDQSFHSPELVIIETKKKLSEQLALVASNGNFQEPRYTKRSTSTLGEMLAFPELKKERTNGELIHSNFDAEYDLNAHSVLLSKNSPKDEYTEENSQKNLSTSKSLPISSTHGADELNGGMSSYSISKATVRKVAHKPNNRSSLKDKISSFFLSRSKKPRGYKHSIVPSIGDVLSSFNVAFTQQTLGDSDESYGRSTETLMFPEAPVKKSQTSGNFAEQQNKSNSSSVSQATLQFDLNIGLSLASGVSRSPPIASIARSLSGYISCLDLASPKSLNPLMDFTKADEEQEQFAFLQNLLLSSGLDSEERMVYKGWHSLDSPLNPSLLYESQHMEDKEKKCQEKHSCRKLLFDSINASLIDISEATLFAAYPWTRRRHHKPWKDGDGDATVAEQVWSIVRKRLVCNKWVPEEPGHIGIVADRLVMDEVAGRKSDETRWLQVCELSKEIGRWVMEELVEELVSELSFSLT
ncbi:uncharacterized protein LOC122055472 [Zingiber officinale]|uniref:uncharacterized protein LOC122055472 n=1 Tax=Zingiber officinale TaxID=94328 RepID=UPI001C4A9518|nr:uncharacterized protein LOC122055472 [Zingiber officinale]